MQHLISLCSCCLDRFIRTTPSLPQTLVLRPKRWAWSLPFCSPIECSGTGGVDDVDCGMIWIPVGTVLKKI